MNSMKKICYAIMLGAMSACGGGSSGGDDELNVSGRWNGNGVVSRDTCAATARTSRLLVSEAVSVLFAHQVAQNGSAVQLVGNSGVQYLGNLVGDDGFGVNAITAQGDDESGASCEVRDEIRYTRISSDDDPTAEVMVRRVETCSDGFSCELVYQGTASRSQSEQEPAPPIDEMPDENFTSCLQLQEREYSGDGGCGISQTQLSTAPAAQDADAVLLEPLGANGVTSFMLSQDPTSASAVTQDLEIMGEIGYQCSIKCGSSLTFVLSCFQEGGSSCEERF